MKDPFVLRPMEPSDTNYVYETMLADLREADASFLPNHLWFPAHREVIRLTLEHAQVVILADVEAPENIMGYLIRCPNYLHWIHVRRGNQWRKRGLAKRLLLETHSQHLPLVWRTKLGHERLTNPLRSRQARHAWWSPGSPYAPLPSLSPST